MHQTSFLCQLSDRVSVNNFSAQNMTITQYFAAKDCYLGVLQLDLLFWNLSIYRPPPYFCMIGSKQFHCLQYISKGNLHPKSSIISARWHRQIQTNKTASARLLVLSESQPSSGHTLNLRWENLYNYLYSIYFRIC